MSRVSRKVTDSFNPFVLNAPFLYALKTSGNLTVFLYFQGVEKVCIENEWVKEKVSKTSFLNDEDGYLQVL